MIDGSKLAKHRELAGYTQDGASVASGIPQGRISKYENGHIKPKIEALFKLADTYGCKVDDFREENNND